MEFGNSFSPEKSKNESVRIPSPASVSSVHSIRPLEWDSGADIGYELKHQSGLSTVERIALKSGTLNLLESCISQDTSTSHTRSNRYIGNPLAQSSPFTAPDELAKVDETRPNTNLDQFRRLVDYSISEYSIDEKVENFESEVPVKVEVLDKLNRVSKLRCDESSKSLDDLRLLGRKRGSKIISSNRTRSSQNLLTAAYTNASEKNSSSSLATLVPSVDEFRNRKYCHKSVQVDDPRKNDDTSPKSSLEFFRKICNRYANDDDSQNPRSKRGSECNNCTDEGSVDGGSFEYVPGSRYIEIGGTDRSKCSSDTESKGVSSVNTWCSEVTDGVALLTKYVNELNVSNKHQIIEKVAKSLMNHLTRFEKSSRFSRTASRESNLLLNSSPELDAGSQLYLTNSTESDPRTRNSKKQFDSSSSHYVESSVSTKDSRFPASLSEACVSSKSSSRLPASPNSFNCGRSCSIKTESHYKIDSKSSNSDQGTTSSKSFSLKEYLKSERDVQLMWIKSNIDHLNNLRKLCENQQTLRDKSNALRKSTSASRSAKNSFQSEVLEKHLSRKKHSIVKRRPVLEPRTTSCEQTSDNTKSFGSYGTLSASESVNKTTMKIISTKKYDTDGEQKLKPVSSNENSRSCSCKHYFRKSNKENVLTSTSAIKRCEKSVKSRQSNYVTTSKQPVSYTILFDKGPNFNIGKRLKVKEYVKQKSVSKVIHRGRRIMKTESITELQSASDDIIADRTVSLQDYLLNNKPEYVNRAEYRRQCLAEIAKLRELRDKSRDKLLSSVRNVAEMNDIIVKSVAVPPPLSVVRLFDDKTIKKETEKKYQQLPEVQSKKLELQRKETYRRNLIMAKVYTKKLQKKVLRGHVNLANNVNVLSI